MDVFVLFWIGLAIVIGMAAGSRGRSGFGWFLLALVISPLLALILIALMPSLARPAGAEAAPTTATHVKCPDCAELILKEARVCKHCGCKLTPPSAATPAAKTFRERFADWWVS